MIDRIMSAIAAFIVSFVLGVMFVADTPRSKILETNYRPIRDWHIGLMMILSSPFLAVYAFIKPEKFDKKETQSNLNKYNEDRQ